MPSLKWMVPQGRPRVFGIYKRVTSIGQAGANDVSIDAGDAGSLEAHHAQVIFDGRDFSVATIDEGATLLVTGKKKKQSKANKYWGFSLRMTLAFAPTSFRC